jgi:hypothetical protein
MSLVCDVAAKAPLASTLSAQANARVDAIDAFEALHALDALDALVFMIKFLEVS